MLPVYSLLLHSKFLRCPGYPFPFLTPHIHFIFQSVLPCLKSDPTTVSTCTNGSIAESASNSEAKNCNIKNKEDENITKDSSVELTAHLEKLKIEHTSCEVCKLP